MFEQVLEKLDQENAQSSSPTPGANAGNDSAPERSAADAAPESKGPLDLSTVEKFKFQGREWTAKDLERAIMRQKDYTQKTQALSEDRKYYDNLAFDLASVVKNPSLATQFKQIYPEKYHHFLDQAFGDYLKQNPAKSQAEQQQQAPIDPELVKRLEKVDYLEKRFFDQEVQSAEAEINAVFSKMNTKYPYADEFSVISRAQSILDQKPNAKITEAVWEQLFKENNDALTKKAETFYSSQVKKQTEANHKAKDTAPGGGIPSQAPKRLTMREATEAAIRDLSQRG